MKKKIFKLDSHGYLFGDKKYAQLYVNKMFSKGHKIKVEFGVYDEDGEEFCEIKVLTSK